MSPNGELSHYSSDILDAASDSLKTKEVISSEDMLAKVDNLNEILKNRETPRDGYFVGSLDVKALYPSLDTKECSKIAGRRVVRSGLRFDGMNWDWATVYVALCMSEKEIREEKMEDVLPKRKAKQGTRPTIRTVNLEEKKDRWRWSKPTSLYTKEEKNRVLEKLVEVSTNTPFEHHKERVEE